jgi:hypothetical protein
MQNLRPRLNAQFWDTKVVKHPFDSIGLEMMFGSISEHCTNLRQVKRCKTFVSGLNAMFRGTKVVKHPFYSIGHKMMFGSVSDHFTNARQVKKDAKHVFRDWMHCFEVPKMCSFYSTPLDPKWCLRVFKSISLSSARTTCKTWVRALMPCFGVTKLWTIHSTPLDAKWCLGVFRSISLTFDR